MTTEERLQFLLQSTESLHSTVQELTGAVADLRGTVADLTRAVGMNSENIRLLANIAAAHQTRLDDLDNRLSG
jgi:chromosome segregation ATPase